MLHSIWFQLYHTLEKAKLEWHKRLIFARAQGEGGINKQVKDSAQVKNVLIKKKKKKPPTMIRVKVTQEST